MVIKSPLSKINLLLMTSSDSSSHFANSWIILIDPGMVFLFIASVESRRMSAGSSLHLIFGKGEGHFRYIARIVAVVFLFPDSNGKILFKYSGDGILYSH